MLDVYTYSKRVAITAAIVLLIGTAFYLLGKHAYFFLLVFAGILMAVMFCGITDWLVANLKLKRGIALLLAVVLFFGLLVAIVWLIAPTIGAQVQEMKQTIPQVFSGIEERLSQYGWGQKILDRVPDNLSGVLPKQQTLFTRISGVFSTTLSVLADVLIVIVTALFFAASPKLYTLGLTRLFPVRQRTHILEVLDKCYDTLKKWLIAMLIDMSVTGIIAAIGFKLIGLPLAFAVALVAFFGEFIQNIGPALAGAVAVLIGLTQGLHLALYALLLYCAIQFLQSYLITPLVYQQTINIPPALLLFFQVMLGIFQGVIGLILAAPLLATLMVLVNELYVKDLLEKKPLHASEESVEADILNGQDSQV